MDALVETVKHGNVVHVDQALQKLGAYVNRPNSCDVYPLHVAVWRNHIPIIERLLARGASTTTTDGESGWTALHRALYAGHLSAAARLLQAGAPVEACDGQDRTPVDLVAVELQRMPSEGASHGSVMYSWGSGANYQLGTGSTDFHLAPLRVDAFQGLTLAAMCAAKFHSAALTQDGRLFTWGWGRGGRLGHPDYNIHSGERALIHPWQVAGLGRRVVVSVAAAKHHMLAVTSAGELWSWGGNRDGKLGYPNVDTHPTPRRVDFRGRAVAVAASNKHSACLTSSGELWTWGANNDGQLGYGTNNSACNPTPRLVEAMKGRCLVAVSLSKRHTVALSSDGEAFTWGHRVVTPRKVPLAGARDTARCAASPAEQQAGPSASAAAAAQGTAQMAASAPPSAGAGADVRFHRNHADVARPEAVLVAAGYTHTTVVTRTGTVLCWRSDDPALRVQEVAGPLAQHRVVAVSASKTRTVVATDTGVVFMWETKERRERPPASSKAQGMAAAVAAAASKSQGAPTGASGFTSASAGGAGSIGNAVPGAAVAAAEAGGGYGPGDGTLAGIAPMRVPGLTRIAQVAVGEKHTLALQAWTVPPMPDEQGIMPATQHGRRRRGSGSEGSDSGSEDDDFCRLFSRQLSGAGLPALRASGRGTSSGAAGSSPPPGSSPPARSVGAAGDMGLISPSTPSGMLGGTPSTGCFAQHGPRARGLRAAAADPRPAAGSSGGPSWSLFNHRPSDDTPRHPSFVGEGGAGGYGLREDEDLFGFGPGDAGGTPRSASRVPSLQVLCQGVVATQLVEPRTVLPILEYADVAGAALLRCYCMAVAVANLDCTLLEAPGTLVALPGHLAAELEHLYKAALLAPPQAPAAARPGPKPGDGATVVESSALLGSSPQPYQGGLDAMSIPMGSSPPAEGTGSLPRGSLMGSSLTGADQPVSALEAFHRRRALVSRLQLGRRPTAAPAWLAGAGAADTMAPQASSRLLASAAQAALGAIGHAQAFREGGAEGDGVQASAWAASASGSMFGEGGLAAVNEERQRLLRTLQRKLAAIEELEAAEREGRVLDAQQHAKMSQRGALQEALQALATGAPLDDVRHAMAASAEVASKLAVAEAQATGSTASASETGAGKGATGRQASKGASSADSAQPAAGGRQRRGSEPAKADAEAGARMPGTAASSVSQTVVPGPPTPGGQTAQQVLSSASFNAISVATPAGTSTATGKSPSVTQSSAGKKQLRRGGLSEFLAGALDQQAILRQQQQAAAQAAAAAAAAVPKGPAWGGVKRVPPVAESGSGLRDLFSQAPIAAAQQSQQQSAATSAPSTGLAQGEQSLRTPTRTPSGPLPLVQGAGAALPFGSSIAAAAGGRSGTAANGAPAGAVGFGAASMSSPAPAGFKLTLGQFMAAKSSTPPIQVAAARGREPAEREREPAGPVWGAPPGSSPAAAKSLLDIQAEQAILQKRAAASRPKLASTAAPAAASGSAAALGSSPPGPRFLMGGITSGASGGLAGPSAAAAAAPNKWYVPEEAAASATSKPLTAIQIEERAMKEIAALYGGRVVARVVAGEGTSGSVTVAVGTGEEPETAAGKGGKHRRPSKGKDKAGGTRQG